MTVLQQLLSACIRSPEALREPLHLSDREVDRLNAIAKQYPICIPPYYLSLIGSDWVHDPIRRLCIPDPMEASPGGLKDTSGETGNTVVTGMQHKYRQTALVLTTNQCSMYCRHCFRKRMVGSNADEIASHLGEMTAYVSAHPEIDNVLLSGGDALINENSRIRQYLEAFCAIEHLRYIRIGTRVPVVLPSRITEDVELLQLLREYSRRKPIIVVTHFNHPREITGESRRAVRALLEAGCPVRNQTVLLRGINDDPDTLAALLNGLTGIGVLPYYVFQCRPAMGVMHQFQVPLLEGQRVVDGARAQLNGQAKQFRYVMSHVTGKIEILGRPFGEETLFKYHQAKSDADANRFFTVRLAEDQCWLGDDI
jgi:KamA family protein